MSGHDGWNRQWDWWTGWRRRGGAGAWWWRLARRRPNAATAGAAAGGAGRRGGGATIRQALWLQTHYDNAAEVGPEEAVECNVDATIVAQGASQIVVAVGTVTSPGDAPSDCFVGRREYRLSGDTFVHAP